MYADDHQMYIMGTDHDLVAQSIMMQGEQALSWYKNNFLSANPEKFQLLIINPRNVDTVNDDEDIFLDGQAISRMERITLLGIQIDENLNFTIHISELCTKASRGPSAVTQLNPL